MATIEVSTWAQLRNAITGAANGDTIKLIADINCNDEIPEGVSSTIRKTLSNLTITGEYTENGVTKRHEIRNLRTSASSAVPIFKFAASATTANITIKGIDFINLILGAPLFQTELVYYCDIYMYIRNCRFSGKRTTYLVYLDNNGYLYMYNSYFNVPYYSTDVNGVRLCYITIAGRGYMTNCRIHEMFSGTYIPSSADSDATCSVFNMRLSGCRVDGEVVGGKYARYHADNVMSGYTPSMQSVYDVNFKLTNTTDSSVPLYAFKGVVKVPICRKDDETITYTISSASTGVIQATEAQMKDTNWLIAQGFDVAPSGT